MARTKMIDDAAAYDLVIGVVHQARNDLVWRNVKDADVTDAWDFFVWLRSVHAGSIRQRITRGAQTGARGCRDVSDSVGGMPAGRGTTRASTASTTGATGAGRGA